MLLIPPLRTTPILDPSVAYRVLWAEFEECASKSSMASGKGPLTEAQLGRASTTDTYVCRAALPPPAKGRSGEVCQAFVAFNLQVARFTKQVRRLQAYCHLGRLAGS